MLPWHYTAEFRRAGEWVRMAPVELRYVNAAGESETIATPAKGLTPVIDNDAYTVTWPDAFGTGRHFRYNISPDHFAKTVVLDGPETLPAASIGSEGLRVEIVMALAWSGQAGNGFGRGRDLTVLRGPEDAEEERQERCGKHPHLRGDGLAALWMAEPRAWDADGADLPMQWGLERRGRRVFGTFGVEVAALAGAAWPVCVDTAIDEEQVGASSDDANIQDFTYPGTTTLTLTDITLNVGRSPNGRWWTAGVIWQLPIPSGATIDTAVPTVYGQTSSAVVNATLAAEDGDDLGTWAAAHTPNTAYVNRTAATAAWAPAAWALGDWRNLPDVSTILQEVVDREGWDSGDRFCFIAYSRDSSEAVGAFRQIYTYDYSNHTFGPKFNCTYTEGGGGGGNPIWYYNMLRRAN